MTHLYGLNSRFYDNCDKKIIIKEKEGKRRGKKRIMSKTIKICSHLQSEPGNTLMLIF